MYAYAYDQTTGEITGSTPTTSLAVLAGWKAQGRPWVEHALDVPRKEYLVVDGAVVARPAPSEEEALALAKAEAYDRSSADYERYVADLGYTAAWQRTAQAQRLALQKVAADDNATAEQAQAALAVEARFQALEEFLVVDLGLYFARVGQEIFAAGSMEDLTAIKWDFHQFDEADPKVTMHVDVFPGLAVAKGKTTTEVKG
ncbi:MAG: hypothetical protein K9K65_11485 [Desulfarculaceae bacterium]|nr:hypothetical protein [Desulfarculaceae bacterium]MCF8048369.1 hypothetical protein [Desulfarculaceae bacterium]MCF8098456.1 hypothetical protein [Desulfarculaceae bacterium]MCF8123897.1 hypothetical protein [Desulfarculaceae bacterium]